ncbi:MBL fold metallo-hydrolase [Demetria terragena]|uniref:MBL fold metallo-hydrolase n=1 Tax=Demetria terragena TaxID=63959 RepID=UPI00037A614E|nr:MBL fold metallo-hydrolase [Demetria terragena]
MTDSEPWRGDAAPRVNALLAPNPGPMTLDGTNTWVLGDSSSDAVAVVDPGPRDEGHLKAVLDHVESLGSRVGLTLLTHSHLDHTEAAQRWAELTGAPVRGAGIGDPLHDGEQLAVGGVDIRVVHTPGHTADSISFHLPDDGVLLTGDMVLGRGTSVVAYPDGEVGAYLNSLQRMAALAPVDVIAPGHGPVVTEPAALLEHYRDHRRRRLDQVAACLDDGAQQAGSTEDVVEAVVQKVYADVPQDVWPAARLTVRAQIEYLRTFGEPA